MKLISIIILMIIFLLFIDYYHKQYRIKYSKKILQYRNSHSFYDNTDYARYKPYREIYTYKILIGFLIIILLSEIIASDNVTSSEVINTNLIKSAIYPFNDVKQNEIGTYYKKYGEKIDTILLLSTSMLNQNNFDNYSYTQLNEQIININLMINELNNYSTNNLEKNLHTLNLQRLYLLKSKYELVLKLKNDNFNNQYINSFNSLNHELNTTNNNYRLELIRIFNEIDMHYEILQDGTIKFVYPEV